MEQGNVEQAPSSGNFQPSQPQQAVNVPASQTTSNKPLVIAGILLGFLLFGVGGYVLGTQRINRGISDNYVAPTESPTAVTQPSPTGAVITQEPSATLPSGWTHKSNSECAVMFGIPPKSDPYYKPYDPNRQPSVTDDAGSGRFWDFPRGCSYPNMLSKFPNCYEQHKQASTMYAAEDEASGYISSAVIVSCIPNTTNLNNQSALSSLKNYLQTYNQDTGEKGMEANTYTVSSSKETNRWGLPVLDLTVSEYFSNPGGQPVTNSVQYTMLATPDYIYEVKVFGASTDSFVKQTAQQIFNNLKFE